MPSRDLQQGMSELTESASSTVQFSSQVDSPTDLRDYPHNEAHDNRNELSPTTMMRKSRSAASNYVSKTRTRHQTIDDGDLNTASGADKSQYRRPYTATAISPSKFSVVVTTKKRPSVNKKNSAQAGRPLTAQRPRSAGLDGWGDFDTDQLLEDDFAIQNPLDEAAEVLNAIPNALVVTDHLEPERVRPRQNRHSAPASTVHNPVEDFPAMLTPATESARQRASKEQPRPVTHVLRPRSLAVVESKSTPGPSRSKTPLAAAAATKQSRLGGLRGCTQSPTGGGPPPSPSPSLSPSQQQNRLPRIEQTPLQQQQPAAQASTSEVPLFDTFLPDTHETRTLVFERFQLLWSLMSSRSSNARTSTASSSSLPLGDALAACKSPFECSMTLMKICKSIGTSLDSSMSTSSFSFWSSKERGVDFNAFCDFVIRNAIHPAVQHLLKAGVSSVDEYVSTLDRILHNVIASPTATGSSQPAVLGSEAEEHRMKELTEIQPLFPQWKVEIASLGKQKAGTKATAITATGGGFEAVGSNPATPDLRIHDDTKSSSAIRVVGTTLLFPSRRELTFQLPAEEAKATHSENIRRKVQLHKSWQPRTALLNVSFNNIPALHAVSERCDVSYSPVKSTHTSMLPNNNNTDVYGVNHRGDLGVCASASSSPQRSGATANQEESRQESAKARASEHHDHREENPENSHVSLDKEEERGLEQVYLQVVADDEDSAQQQLEEQVLVCGECTAGEAVLWCASCFGVFCVSCWQTLHLMSVDTSVISEQSSFLETVLAPTAKSLKPNSTELDGNLVSPPVAMLYLPTKPLATGKLAKGACSKWRPAYAENNDEHLQSAASTEGQTPMLTVSSHSILPPLLKSQSLKTLDIRKSSGHHESTSNMVKALMLGVSTLSSSSSSGSSSNYSPVATSGALMAPRKYADPKKRAKLHPAAVLLDPALLFADV